MVAEVRKKLTLKCAPRAVRRVINKAGYFLPARINKRVLGKSDKKKRLVFAENFGGQPKAFWLRPGFGDAKFRYLSRTKAELAAASAKTFAAVATENSKAWLTGRTALVLHGEKRMRGQEAAKALLFQNFCRLPADAAVHCGGRQQAPPWMHMRTKHF